MSRRKAYKALFHHHIDEETIADIRAAWHTGTPLGNDRFKEKIEKTLTMKVGYAKRGRPRKE
jgi:putative transposase